MSLRDRHEEFLAKTLEDRSLYGQDVTFDLSNGDLEWFNNVAGVAPVGSFVLGGIVNVVTDESDIGGDSQGVLTESLNVTVRLSSLLTECGGGVPGENTVIVVTTATGVRVGVVESGQTRVDSQLGRVHYFLTELETIA